MLALQYHYGKQFSCMQRLQFAFAVYDGKSMRTSTGLLALQCGEHDCTCQLTSFGFKAKKCDISLQAYVYPGLYTGCC